MKEKNRSRLLFVLLFVTIIINLGLVAFIVATMISLSQSKQEIKALKDNIWVLQTQVDSIKPFKPSYTIRQQVIVQTIVGNPDIAKLIKTKPVLGGNWGCWSEKSIKFLTEDKFFILYDDGHLMGAMVVRAKDPQNIKTWKVLWNTLL